ncbi:MAG TPA: DUF4412 domain-containing protein [Gemmatimonadaceae bacterium]
MRRMLASVLLPLAAAAPLAAQQFEGTVNMKMTGNAPNAEGMTMRMAIKGDQQVTIVTLPATSGPLAGQEVRAIMDPKSQTVTTLIPMPPGMGAMVGQPDAKGMKMIVDLSKSTGPAAASKADIKKLGTTQKIAGLSCDDYQITDENGKSVKACITSSLGRFVLPDMSGGMGGRRGGGGGQPAWAKAFGDRPAFPLKVWSDDGNTNMEVTSVDRAPVAASLFEIPDGYVDMSAMMRGRSGGL